MAQVIKKNQATAKYRRIAILIYSDADHVTPWAGSVTGVKAQLAFNGGAETASTNDIVRVAGAHHYVELTQAESNTDDGEVMARVAAAAGRDEGLGVATIVNYDPLAAGADYSANLAAIEADTQDIQSRIPAALVSGRIDASVGAMAADVITDTALASSAATEMQTGVALASALATLDGKVDTIDANVDTLLTADATYKKNVAVSNFVFYMALTNGSPGTGLTVAATISKDGGAFAAVAGAVTEISAGWYKVNLAQAEMNADEIALKFTATGAAQRNIKIRCQS